MAKDKKAPKVPQGYDELLVRPKYDLFYGRTGNEIYRMPTSGNRSQIADDVMSPHEQFRFFRGSPYRHPTEEELFPKEEGGAERGRSFTYPGDVREA